jgi:hypothetical protein
MEAITNIGSPLAEAFTGIMFFCASAIIYLVIGVIRYFITGKRF